MKTRITFGTEPKGARSVHLGTSAHFFASVPHSQLERVREEFLKECLSQCQFVSRMIEPQLAASER